jgi:hypothetical protein
MTTVFLSYSSKDHVFAELAQIKLAEAGITLWRDSGQLRAGSDWRRGIEKGISDSFAVIVALSEHSIQSSYVTFEWAFALGRNKVVLPLKLSEGNVHPRLQVIQYLDFSTPGALPWESLIAEILEIETDSDAAVATPDVPPPQPAPGPEANHARAILAYLAQRGYQMASFDRLRRRVDENLTDEDFRVIIDSNPTLFRHARLAEGKAGLARL